MQLDNVTDPDVINNLTTQVNNVVSSLNSNTTNLNNAIKTLNEVTQQLRAAGVQGLPTIQLALIPMPKPAVQLLREAIESGDSTAVAQIVESKSSELATELSDPANATAVANALTNTSLSAANAGNIAGSLATLTQGLPASSNSNAAKSAGTLAGAISTVIAKPEVIAAAPRESRRQPARSPTWPSNRAS